MPNPFQTPARPSPFAPRKQGPKDPSELAAIEGLKRFQDPGATEPQVGTAEMFRLAHMDPSSMAPGAPEYWRYKLQGRLGDENAVEDRQKQEVGQVGTANLAATLGGFHSPQEASQAAQSAELAKILSPANVATIQQQGALEQQRRNFAFDREQMGTGGPAPAAPPPTATPGGVQVNPDAPYNGGFDAVKNLFQGLKSKVVATPMTPLLQEDTMAGVEQALGAIPGSRALQAIHKMLGEARSNVGGLRSPAAAYVRLHMMRQLADQAEAESNNPASRLHVGPNGKPQLASTPQQVMQSQSAIKNLKVYIQDEIGRMQQQHPGIEKSILSSPGGDHLSTGGGNPPPHDPYADPNYQPR